MNYVEEYNLVNVLSLIILWKIFLRYINEKERKNIFFNISTKQFYVTSFDQMIFIKKNNKNECYWKYSQEDGR